MRVIANSIIHQTLTWTKGPLTCTQMFMRVMAQGGVWTPFESLHWKLTLGEMSLVTPGNRTCISGVRIQCCTNWIHSHSFSFSQEFCCSDFCLHSLFSFIFSPVGFVSVKWGVSWTLLSVICCISPHDVIIHILTWHEILSDWTILSAQAHTHVFTQAHACKNTPFTVYNTMYEQWLCPEKNSMRESWRERKKKQRHGSSLNFKKCFEV